MIESPPMHGVADRRSVTPRLLVARNLFIADGVIALLFAVGFLAIPQQLLTFFGIGVTPSSVFVARILAGPVLALGVMHASARDIADTPAGRRITLGHYAFDVVGVPTTAVGVAVGVAAPFGLLVTGLLLIQGLWRTYLLFGVYQGRLGT